MSEPLPPVDGASKEVQVVPAEAARAGLGARAKDFLSRVLVKAGEDDIFFLAGAISFNVLVAVVPLLLFAVGVSGIVLTSRFPDPAAVVVSLLVENLPAIGGDIALVETVERQISSIVEQRAGFTLLGTLLLVWFSTRLVGTLRVALREIFDIAQDRGVVGGKLFDAKVVVVGGLLLVVNIGAITTVTTLQGYGADLLGLEGWVLSGVERTVAITLGFFSIWVLFLVIYRYLPARWIPWRTALIAATFASVVHEILKWAFGWYVSGVANYQTTYGNLVTLAVFVLWIYYEAVVFVLGGEIAQVWTMRRARRVKARNNLFGGSEGKGAQKRRT